MNCRDGNIRATRQVLSAKKPESYGTCESMMGTGVINLYCSGGESILKCGTLINY